MVRKRCRHCQQTSYSLSASGAWICPHCGQDITDQPVQRPDRATHGLLPLGRGLPPSRN